MERDINLTPKEALNKDKPGYIDSIVDHFI